MRFILFVACSLLLPSPAFAWSKGGHMVSGAIAYAVLKKEHPEAIPKVIAILKQHPQYESHWLKRFHDLKERKHLSDEDADLFLFMEAARWPDEIRSDSEYHHGDWHYINLPYKPPGQPESVQPAQPSSDNIIRAFDVNRDKAKDVNTSGKERAIALCWVLHLIGDAHQPLHTTSFFTTEYPKGDRGGNKFLIRAKPGASVIPLHQYWDDLIIGSENFQSIRNKATELRLRDDLRRDKLTELSNTYFEHLVKNESFVLAKDVCYRNGKLAGSPDREHAPALPEDYAHAAKAVAERRIVLAGYRIAGAMVRIVEKP